ncbi:uncharacterized protein EI90DRAFT_2917471, partial [Cantharellus anzutake]|uniref:uncharacterized protein n=1 Tax=Cantharellus anzutake TaxID=1750568 RepID=UPI001908849A
YALSTVDQGIPRVRSIIHRSVLHLEAPVPLLVSTTDIRTPKVGQILASDGNIAEIAWWIEGASEQYRITARTHILPSKNNPLYANFPFTRLSPHLDLEYAQQWWEEQRIDHFNNKMGGVLRASFCRATPGADLPSGYDTAKKWPQELPKYGLTEHGTKEEGQVREALGNFSLLVLEPFAVDRVELGIVPNRRTQWDFKGEVWVEKIVVP